MGAFRFDTAGLQAVLVLGCILAVLGSVDARSEDTDANADSKIGVLLNLERSDFDGLEQKAEAWQRAFEQAGVQFVVVRTPRGVSDSESRRVRALCDTHQSKTMGWDTESEWRNRGLRFEQQGRTEAPAEQTIGEFSKRVVVYPASERADSHTVLWAALSAIGSGKRFVLEVDPEASGDMDELAQAQLSAVGHFVKANGESLKGTATWRVSGSAAPQQNPVVYTFNPKTNCLYAITRGWPTDPLTLFDIPISSTSAVSLLGSEETVEWQGHNGHIQLHPPKGARTSDRYAYVFKVTGIA